LYFRGGQRGFEPAPAYYVYVIVHTTRNKLVQTCKRIRRWLMGLGIDLAIQRRVYIMRCMPKRYAELVVSSLAMVKTIASTQYAYSRRDGQTE